MKKVIILFLLLMLNCDSSQSKSEHWNQQLLCYSLGVCNDARGTRFGIIGDSWTDLIAGQPLIRTLRIQLEEDHGYQFTGTTLGGARLSVVNRAGSHFKVIENAGPDLKYMVISLGGNDILTKYSSFLPNVETELNQRLAVLEQEIFDFVESGNSYKKNRWGGGDLIWIFHGYDYINPDIPASPNSAMCRKPLLASGFTNEEIDIFHPQFNNNFNEMLHHAASIHRSIRVIDLRGSIGGPPFSSAAFMYDCIHPNTTGFTTITTRFASQMKVWSGDER